jgi:cytochrome c biogenesis protein CcdA
MAVVGVVVTFVGFLIAASSVGIMSGTSGRLVMVLVGIAVSLLGIIGVLNPAYQKDAVWKK